MHTHAKSRIDSEAKSNSPVLDDSQIGLLAALEREEPFYEPSLPQSAKYESLCRLESLGYVRYCPYPEDFWVILPSGREALLRRARS